MEGDDSSTPALLLAELRLDLIEIIIFSIKYDGHSGERVYSFLLSFRFLDIHFCKVRSLKEVIDDEITGIR